MSLNGIPMRKPCHLISFLGNESTHQQANQRSGLRHLRDPQHDLPSGHGPHPPLLSTMTTSLYIVEVVIHPRAGCACDLGLGTRGEGERRGHEARRWGDAFLVRWFHPPQNNISQASAPPLLPYWFFVFSSFSWDADGSSQLSLFVFLLITSWLLI
jgi:hypothetical protein